MSTEEKTEREGTKEREEEKNSMICLSLFPLSLSLVLTADLILKALLICMPLFFRCGDFGRNVSNHRKVVVSAENS